MGGATEIVLGIDSGGSKTIGCAVTRDGTVIGTGFGGGTNLYFVPEDEAIFAIQQASRQALAEVDGEVAAVYLSAPGLTFDVAELALEGTFRYRNLVVEGDAPAAFRGALPQGDGVVVLTGTGSFAYGEWRGRTATVGGWGSLLGDEGSGYWIAVEGLKAVVRASDGLGPPTALTRLFRKTLLYGMERELVGLVYRKGLSRERIASLATVVSDAADEGDAVAREIFRNAAGELVKQAAAVISRLGVGRDDEVSVAVTGGVSAAGSPLLDPFVDALNLAAPNVVLVPARFPPFVGAVLRACEVAALPVDESFIERVAGQIDAAQTVPSSPQLKRRSAL
ncbi:N-acetylglucosamine kinase [Limnochorda pilosa]|uniref:N-acetylglucosamine kinase n=1 Tax=Limnochorda pilosa TaxID=1555112 RepID=A0A0K2SI69_LIMPI|nr:BadF/BadG/BcrA/BcrD ATPase family protein [Limnochorda pilosa]BAS26780.1 N-acetylglucosamine kinase [Limnochorda pilosa]